MDGLAKQRGAPNVIQRNKSMTNSERLEKIENTPEVCADDMCWLIDRVHALVYALSIVEGTPCENGHQHLANKYLSESGYPPGSQKETK